MNMHALLLTGTILSGALFAMPAQAACKTVPAAFRPTQNETATVRLECDSRGGQLGVRPRDNATPAAANIIGYPRNGEISANSRLTYIYRPHRGFRGNDEFIVRVCARPAQGQQGCATLNYQVTVR